MAQQFSYDTVKNGNGFGINDGYTSDFNTGKIRSLKFPSTETELQNHYMVFYVNEILGGTHAKSVEKRRSQDSSRSQASGATVFAKGDNIKENITQYSNKASEQYKEADGVFDKATAGVNAGFAKALSAVADFTISQYVRTNTVLVLPPPENLQVSYSADWEGSDMGEGMLGAAMAMADTIQNGGGGGDMMGVIAKRTAYNIMDETLGSNLSGALTKNANNPRKELLFTGNVQLRTFEYTWKLNPKSAEDSKAVWDIIQMFKYHHLPELNTGGLYLQFPNLFDIEFFSYGERNDWIPVTLSCALTNISVNYFGSGSSSFFEQTNSEIVGNAPASVELTLTFMETEPLTRNIIDPNSDFTFNLMTKGTPPSQPTNGQIGMSLPAIPSQYKNKNGGIY